ncbi:hypothetical protein [Actinoalloteichus hymeniacidonis]|uniref:Uncharacterized protein n=1 Tax=Actinoalloteichus hymeniacidonis TaxID=340345 RepID=A0AAC9HNH3_9PSEU|nr:hypothetical protein [Actinoalloteichus hymeniacidonis]AOS62348.1 hypothetical protein TL08_07650 [Actinoalloteichus hymeniacidonis]MBB5909624.1 hypothetical protein [Actinoalloteichus hymeniacidonis]
MNQPRNAPPSDEQLAVPSTPPRKPPVVIGLLILVLVAVLTSAIGSVLVYSGGATMAEENLIAAIDESPEGREISRGMSSTELQEMMGPEFWDTMVAERQDTMSARASMAIFLSTLLLVFGLLALNSALWARILITIVIPFAVFPHMLITEDYPPAMLETLSMISVWTALLAIAFCWLPGHGKHSRAVKQARSSTA